MKTKILLLSVISLVMISCSNSEHENLQTTEQSEDNQIMPSDSEINVTIKEIYEQHIAQQQFESEKEFILSFPLVSNRYYITEDESNITIQNLFSNKDLAFMTKQSKFRNNFILDSTVFMYYKILKSNEIYEGPVNEITIPLFSIDKQIILVRESYGKGFLCGYSSVTIYKKKNNIWVTLAVISAWQS